MTARRDLDALLETLRADGQDVVEVEEEYVVYDSALQLDDGWLDEKPLQTPARGQSLPEDLRDAPKPGWGPDWMNDSGPGLAGR